MKNREELLVSLSLSPWSLGLKQSLRTEAPPGRVLPRGSRLMELYPSSASYAVLLFAWSYWLLDGCCGCSKEPEIEKDGKALSFDCSLARVLFFTTRRTPRIGSNPESMKRAGEGHIRIEGEEHLRILIAPGAEGGVGIRHGDRFIPRVFPEGDGLCYYDNEKESRILPPYLIDEALNFADAVSKVMLEY